MLDRAADVVDRRCGTAPRSCAPRVPSCSIDTDDWCVPEQARRGARSSSVKPELGVPSLYYATHIDSTGEELDDDDYAALRGSWSAWKDRPARERSTATATARTATSSSRSVFDQRRGRGDARRDRPHPRDAWPRAEHDTSHTWAGVDQSLQLKGFHDLTYHDGVFTRMVAHPRLVDGAHAADRPERAAAPHEDARRSRPSRARRSRCTRTTRTSRTSGHSRARRERAPRRHGRGERLPRTSSPARIASGRSRRTGESKTVGLPARERRRRARPPRGDVLFFNYLDDPRLGREPQQRARGGTCSSSTATRPIRRVLNDAASRSTSTGAPALDRRGARTRRSGRGGRGSALTNVELPRKVSQVRRVLGASKLG